MRAIRLFIKEGEGTKGKTSAVQGPGTFEKTQKAPITYRVPEAASALVREEEFAKQLRLTRYLAGASLGPPRAVEKVGERARSVTMPKPRTKAQAGNKKGAEAELPGKGGVLSNRVSTRPHPVGVAVKSSDLGQVVDEPTLFPQATVCSFWI